MPKSDRLTVRLPRDKMLLVEAYAKDRGLPLASIAASALMNEVNRHAGRTHLLDQVVDLLERRYPALRALDVLRELPIRSDVPMVPSPSGEGHR